MKHRITLVTLIVPPLIVAPVSAWAGNGAHPRTPVEWSGAPCMTIVDRSVEPVHALSYSIPYEDVDVTPDEVEGSRAHQFFGFCRDRHLEDILPGWINEVDVMAAGAKGLGDPLSVDLELEVLDNAPDWAGCFTRITGDDERRPITFAAAAEPVLWDTGTLAAGTWVVDGYTFEPWFNMWTPHPGVFKIVDDPDPAASPPAGALTFAEQIVTFGDDASISGCVDAMAGTTMDLYWSNGNIAGEPNWEPFAADLAAETGAFDLPFTPPAASVSNSVMIRLDLRDPMGREWSAYSRAYISVVEGGAGDDGCDSDGGFVSNPCDTETGGTEAGESSDAGASSSDAGVEDSTGPSQNDAGDTGGCSCSTPATPPSPFGWAFAGLLVLTLSPGLRWRRAGSKPSARR